MSCLQPDLGEIRRHQLRNSPFSPTPLFHSQLVTDGEEVLLKNGTPKTLRATSPIKSSFFMVCSIRKEATTGNTPKGDNPQQAVTSHFPQVGGTPTTEVTKVIFNLIAGVEGMETPLPNDYPTSINSPVGRLHWFRRDWLKGCSNNR